MFTRIKAGISRICSPLAAGSFGVLAGLIVDQRRLRDGTLLKRNGNTRRTNTYKYAIRVLLVILV